MKSSLFFLFFAKILAINILLSFCGKVGEELKGLSQTGRNILQVDTGHTNIAPTGEKYQIKGSLFLALNVSILSTLIILTILSNPKRKLLFSSVEQVEVVVKVPEPNGLPFFQLITKHSSTELSW